MNGSILAPLVQRKCTTQSNVKVMFIVAYDTDGVILHHTVPQRQTVNAATTAISSVIIFVQHSGESDNARAHTANVVMDLLRR